MTRRQAGHKRRCNGNGAPPPAAGLPKRPNKGSQGLAGGARGGSGAQTGPVLGQEPPAAPCAGPAGPEEAAAAAAGAGAPACAAAQQVFGLGGCPPADAQSPAEAAKQRAAGAAQRRAAAQASTRQAAERQEGRQRLLGSLRSLADAAEAEAERAAETDGEAASESEATEREGDCWSGSEPADSGSSDGAGRRRRRSASVLASGPGFTLARGGSPPCFRLWLSLAAPALPDDITVRCRRRYIEVVQRRPGGSPSPDGLCLPPPPPLRAHHVVLPAALDLRQPPRCQVTPGGQLYMQAAIGGG